MLFNGARQARNTFDDRAMHNLLGEAMPRADTPCVIATVSGTVVMAPRNLVAIQTSSNETVDVHNHNRRTWIVTVGQSVSAGDPLNDGPRSHRDLLRVWGRPVFAMHLLKEFANQLAVPRVYAEILVRELLAWDRVIDPGDAPLRKHQRVRHHELEALSRQLHAEGRQPPHTVPILRSLRAIARDHGG